ncbi:MAG: outer membrane protein [Hyphomicrobiales bacterium]
MPLTYRFALISSVLLGILPVNTSAADLFGDNTGVTYWQGAYAGLHLGGGLGSAGGLTTGGTVVGAHGGYNFQAGQFVSGGEIDYSSSKIKNSSSNESFNQNWLTSFRARGGYTFGNLLTYGTLGLAYGPTEYVKNGTKTDASKLGWILGGGVEAMIAPNVSLRGELLHYDLGSSAYSNGAGGSISLDTTSNIIRTGLSYKF